MRKQILVMISVIGFFQSPLAHGKELACHLFLGQSLEGQSKLSPTASLIAYLNYLVEQQIVNLESFRNLSEELKIHGKIITNPVPHIVTLQGMQFTQSVYQVHYENFEQYLQQTNLNHQELLKWALAMLAEAQRVQLQKDKAEMETKAHFTRMRFHQVEKGTFLMGEYKETPVELTYDIEVMSTLVTQWMWVEEMKENPSKFKEGDYGIELVINGRSIKLQPEHPVENITWYSAAAFANRMSKKHGFKEVYDFSGVTIKQGSKPEDGTLDVEGEVKINGANIYETEGYRLPTEAEQEYILSDRGRSKTKHFTGMTNLNFADYAWDSDEQTHAVAEKLPLMMGDRDFYDLYGNVFEWGNDKLISISLFQAGKNPKGAEYGKERSIRGGARINWGIVTSSSRRAWEANGRQELIGFRLVRTLK